MLNHILDLPHGVHGLEAVGAVTAADYATAFAPLVRRAQQGHGRLRLLYQFGPEFERITAGGLWADGRLGTNYLTVLVGCAIVSDLEWIREPSRRIGAWLPCPIRVYDNSQREEAAAWLESLPETETVAISPVTYAKAYIGGTGAALAGIARLMLDHK